MSGLQKHSIMGKVAKQTKKIVDLMAWAALILRAIDSILDIIALFGG